MFPDIYKMRETSPTLLRKTIRRLGLLHRVAYLKGAAAYVTTKFEGKFPTSPEKLRNIPGVGDYIANAVALYAYNKREFPVDVNIVRILDRAFNIRSPKRRPCTDRVYQDFLETIVPKSRERDFMYGLLDLASEICVNNRRPPKCSQCPMPSVCNWYQQNVPESKLWMRGD
jgi:A/G-specific adenine glycosylase